ncbi:MAG: hypothetical protein AAFR91_02245 [Pseudomonadota bacterium]
MASEKIGASEIWFRSQTFDLDEPMIEISVTDNETGVSPDIAVCIFDAEPAEPLNLYRRMGSIGHDAERTHSNQRVWADRF